MLATRDVQTAVRSCSDTTPDSARGPAGRAPLIEPECAVAHRTSPVGFATLLYAGETHYLRVHVAHIRAKLEPDPSRPRYLITEPGVGYRLRDPAA